MSGIHVLDPITIDKIAAGEVVERPASVVKELVENAIDAGATRLSIEIEGGGSKLLRVSDNGCGIAPEDVPLAFLRHATSKIQSAGDLGSLSSLGFRGEALASICAVARVELITKRSPDLTATRYLIEGGREKLVEEIGAPDGTTVVVRDLFYNTPGRAKFLKTAVTEAAHVGAIVERLIMSNPDIAFTFLVNGQKKLLSSGSGKLTDALFPIYGKEVMRQLLPVCTDEGDLKAEGLLGKPQISRGNRDFETFSVNGRYLKSRILQRAIEDAYGTRLMQHQYPFACLMLTVDTSLVDVNVHPTKLEVRFSDEQRVYHFLRDCVKAALEGQEMIRTASAGPEPHSVRKKETEEAGEREVRKERPPEPFERRAGAVLEEASKAEQHLWEAMEETEKAVPAIPAARNKPQEEDPEPLEPEKTGKPGTYVQQSFQPAFLSEEAKPYRRIVGQILDTYWICEYSDKVFVFDQHAAHERVLFERFMKQYEKREISSQLLAPPLVVTLDAKEEALLTTYLEAFAALGFEIEAFGERDYLIRAVPYSLGNLNSGDLFRGLLDQLEFSGDLRDLRAYITKVATEACKAAVKGGESLSKAEAQMLLEDLMECEDPYHCPHGRPTILSFTREEIEKRFKRIV